MQNIVDDSVVAYLDILGFQKLMEDEAEAEKLLKVIIAIAGQQRECAEVSHRILSNGTSQCNISTPSITSFSGCIVMSFPLKDFRQQYNISHAVNGLLHYIQQLADGLIEYGYLLRGGISKGKLYHKKGVVFGHALIEAYNLERSEAKNPRILISDDLATEYNAIATNNFLKKDDMNKKKDEYYLDYLMYSFQSDSREYKINLYENAISKSIENLPEKDNIYEKWYYFAEKFINAAYTDSSATFRKDELIPSILVK